MGFSRWTWSRIILDAGEDGADLRLIFRGEEPGTHVAVRRAAESGSSCSLLNLLGLRGRSSESLGLFLHPFSPG